MNSIHHALHLENKPWRKKGKKRTVDVVQAADEERYIRCPSVYRFGGQMCQIQLCIFRFKPIDFHKSKFSSSGIFKWLGRSFMISENEVLKTACGSNREQVL